MLEFVLKHAHEHLIFFAHRILIKCNSRCINSACRVIQVREKGNELHRRVENRAASAQIRRCVGQSISWMSCEGVATRPQVILLSNAA